MLSANFQKTSCLAKFRATNTRSIPLRPVTCRASATAWDSWDSYMQSRRPVTEADKKEQGVLKDLSSMIAKSAGSYKPRFIVPQESHTSVEIKHLDKIQVKDLPKDLHEKLEAIGVAALKGAMGIEKDLDYLEASFTTTDIDAALSVSGTVVNSAGSKNAILSFVVTETERQASWSRLEGLILHWACGNAPGGAWHMPPPGWTCAPNKAKDAGGAWQCQFEKQIVGDNQSVYVLVMQLPLAGVLKSGGIVFVLKGMQNQADRWLKDSDTDKDFYIDLQRLPVTKL